MANIVKTRIQFRRDNTANWELYGHIVPAQGEPCFDYELGTLKIGDGVKSYAELTPIGGDGNGGIAVSADGKSIVMSDGVFKLVGFDAADVGAVPRKNAECVLEWVVAASSEDVENVQSTVNDLQADVQELQGILIPSGEGEQPLLSRIEANENAIEILNGDETVEGSVLKTVKDGINDFATKMSADGTVNTFKELIDYVADHGSEITKILDDISELQGLVDSVPGQIESAIADSEKNAGATFERKKFEVANAPSGTLVDYRDKEIRIMCPVDAQFVKQAVGDGGDGNNYYIAFNTYAPSDDAVGYIEHLGDQVDPEILTDLKTDKYGRRYQPTWLAVARYDDETGTWSYYGEKSTAAKYIGWNYQIDWYDVNGKMIGSDAIRINLSNESCHNVIEPYYMANYIKGVKVNGTLLEAIDGVVDVNIPEQTLNIKGSDEIDIAEDGTLTIKSISFSKIVQDESEEVVLDGGGAAMRD